MLLLGQSTEQQAHIPQALKSLLLRLRGAHCGGRIAGGASQGAHGRGRMAEGVCGHSRTGDQSCRVPSHGLGTSCPGESPKPSADSA